MKRRRAGRPELPASEKRGQLLAFRVRADEAQRLRKAASASNLKLGAWLRKVALTAAGRPPKGDPGG